MSELSYNLVVDNDLVARVREELRSVAIHQNKKADPLTRWRTPRTQRQLQWLIVALLSTVSAVCALAATVSALYGSSGLLLRPSPLVPLVGFGLGCATLAAAIALFTLQGSYDSLLDGLTRFIANRQLAPLRNAAPFQAHHTLGTTAWTVIWTALDDAETETPLHQCTLNPEGYQLALLGEVCCALFTNARRLQPKRVLVFGPGHRDTVAAALLRSGVESKELPLYDIRRQEFRPGGAHAARSTRRQG